MKKNKLLQDPVLKKELLVWQIIKFLYKHKRLILGRVGLTCSQFDILLTIYSFSDVKEEIIQVDLADKSGIDPMTTSTILRNLEKKELITRCRSATNTRTVVVQLTDKGLKMLQLAVEQIKLSNRTVYENIDEDGLKQQLLELTERLNN